MGNVKGIDGERYIFTNSERPSSGIYILRKHFPRIQWVHVEGKGIAFLPEKRGGNEGVIGEDGQKGMSYQKLRRITRLFDTDLSKEEKLELMGSRRPLRKEDLRKE